MLNMKVADTLRTMPDHKETAFATVSMHHIDLPLFVMRHGTVPDGEEQIYSFDRPALKQIAQRLMPEEKTVISSFEYTLNVSPMSPRRIFALMLASRNRKGTDPLIGLHAPEFARDTENNFVLHFTDEASMHSFVCSLEQRAI